MDERLLIPEEDAKKSFLVYLDSFFYVMALPVEQRGELFSSLLWYATGAVRRVTPMDRLIAGAECDTLSPEARMAFYFMAEAIRRDTINWNKKRKRCKEAALKREAAKRGNMPCRSRGVDVSPDEEEMKGL